MLSKKEITLAKYRLEKANEMLQDADTLFINNAYKSCNNRTYYSILHAMRAVLALTSVDFTRHSGVIQYFQKEYIKTKVFDRNCSNIIMSASKIRNASDYDDFYIASIEESQKQLENAHIFYDVVKDYIENF